MPVALLTLMILHVGCKIEFSQLSNHSVILFSHARYSRLPQSPLDNKMCGGREMLQYPIDASQLEEEGRGEEELEEGKELSSCYSNGSLELELEEIKNHDSFASCQPIYVELDEIRNPNRFASRQSMYVI